MKNFIKIVFLTVLTIVLFTACSSGTNSETTIITGKPTVEIEMQNGGKMVLELYPELAPETVSNFVGLVEKGFYNGLTFHRIVEGFMIQGGDPEGTGMGGSDKNIKGEFSSNGFDKNTLSHTKGVISMARSSDPNSASSQFFIVQGDASNLDGEYAAFGKLTEGEGVLDRIAATPVYDSGSGEVSTPETPIVIKTIKLLSK